LQNPVFELAKELISRVSVTPEDAGCQELIAARLTELGFQTRQINAEGVHNLWAWRGTGSPHLMFAGHTDVVPPGPVEQWQTPPFEPTVKDGQLYGRGAADMKSSLAAMIVAVEDATKHAEQNCGTLSFLITSDEEGVATYGTRYAIDVLANEGIRPDYCVVGEPSSSEQLGDVVRSGRRGSLNAKLKVIGTQGHVAYPQDANNPIHNVLAALSALTAKEWDSGNDFYPPTSFQISNINGGTGATNVIPGELAVDFNFRFNTEQTAAGLSAGVEEILHNCGVTYAIEWALSGEPFLTLPGALTAAVTQAIQAETGLTTELSTSGGTSDGRFISPWDKPGSGQVEVVELGPLNATIHKIDECVAVDDLMPLAKIYQRIIKTLLTQ
jgi:succinyl-diaminopimelate desuccinylase|tara:strand:+ start:2297 stop:3448 length:1152 start_codon:yes stop_codon:yes gene_type:complete